jgi:hypothetical protein
VTVPTRRAAVVVRAGVVGTAGIARPPVPSPDGGDAPAGGEAPAGRLPKLIAAAAQKRGSLVIVVWLGG